MTDALAESIAWLPFTKMQGAGNDFVMVDVLQGLPPEQVEALPAQAKRLTERRFGIGGDGLILLERGDTTPFRMRMFNPDGSESEMCGNGLRCLGRLVLDHGHTDAEEFAVETGAGVLEVGVMPSGEIRLDMGAARLTRGEIGMTGPNEERFLDEPVVSVRSGTILLGTAVSMGNPHLVIFVDNIAAVELESLGPVLEQSPLFPQRTNVHFVQVEDRVTLRQRTWERGAGATLACGTGACASAVAGFLTGRSDRNVQVHLPGGVLTIEYREDDHVLLTGPAETVFEGEWPDVRL